MTSHHRGRPSRHIAGIEQTTGRIPTLSRRPTPASLRNLAIPEAHPCRFPFGEPAVPRPGPVVP
jgi:hypothetical protein